jgi:hypothetical protein
MQEHDDDYMQEIYIPEYYEIYLDDEWIEVSYQMYCNHRGVKRLIPSNA